MANFKKLLFLSFIIAFVFGNICYAAPTNTTSDDEDETNTSNVFDDEDETNSSNTSNSSNNEDNRSSSSKNRVTNQSSTNAKSTAGATNSTTTSGVDSTDLGISNALSFVLIAVGVLLIFLSIAILIRMKK